MLIYDLPASRTSVRLVVDESDWCSVQLVDNQENYIGGDLIGVIRGRLHKALVDPDAIKVCGELNGGPVGWVTAFADSEVTVYATAGPEPHVKLFFQDRSLNIIGTIHLSAEDRECWCRRLANIKE